MKYYITILVLLLGHILSGQDASPAGIWEVFEDQHQTVKKAHIEIYKEDGKYYGRILKLFGEDPNAVCRKCDKKRRGKPLEGMVVIEGLRKYGKKWKKGSLLNPASGKTYRCSIWLEENNKNQLNVRGKHWTGLYKTQVWQRL